MPTPEEMVKFNKERIKSDAELVEEGAGVTPDGKILTTEEQQKDKKIEMGDHFYKKAKEFKQKINYNNERSAELNEKLNMREEINGIEFDLHWAEYSDPEQYVLYFPQLSKETEFNNGQIRMPMGMMVDDDDKEREEIAKKLLQYASSAAREEKDVKKVFRKVEEYRDDLMD